ncbi:berberine family protein [Diplodia corticola]|uniref:Berberine family protein n=1 Tax=Diplodia corticola TaxID=236234 RepID=A0A1J9RVV2_9PEZI|nr:berberine family protein [Diplodia corticola]OJD32503.1 berberine family protein [Diplodia corticola]
MADSITFFEPVEVPAFNLGQKQHEPSTATVNLLDTVPLPSTRTTPATVQDTITSLQSSNIPVFTPGHSEYERRTARPNLLFRATRPDCVAQPTSAAHVATTISLAKSARVPVTIQCAFHSWAGFSTASRGIVLDVSKLNAVDLDAAARTVTVGAGCRWEDVYRALPAGLVVTGARAPTVGVSGFTLGGGLGPFTRRFGLGSDALLEATVVTADGALVTVGENDDPASDAGRLFWALRGAGAGNFGVLVRVKLRVQELQGEDVVGGRVQWSIPSEDEGVVAAMNKVYSAEWPSGMTVDSTWMCDLRQTGGDQVRLVASFDGSKDEFDGVVDSCVEQPELANGLKQRCLPQKSSRFLNETLEAQWSEEIERFLPENKSYSVNSSFAFGNDSKNVEQITAIIREEMKNFRSRFSGEQAEFSVTWMHAGGKAAEKNPTDTAFFWREAAYHTYLTVVWEDKRMEKDMRDFLETVKDRLRSFSLEKKAAYVNFPDGKLASEPYEEAYYGDNSNELRRVKQIWDKDNFFNWSQGVKLP